MLRSRAITGVRPQSASLIALSAFAVHQLRSLFVYGATTDDELAEQSHTYLVHALPLLLGFALAALTARLVQKMILSGQTAGSERRIKATTYGLGIAAVFCCQELAEGVLVAGHATGLAAIFSAGGWAALPLAAVFGLLAALVDRGMEAIETRLASPVAQEDHAKSSVRPPEAPARLGRRLSPLATGLAERPPPSPA